LAGKPVRRPRCLEVIRVPSLVNVAEIEKIDVEPIPMPLAPQPMRVAEPLPQQVVVVQEKQSAFTTGFGIGCGIIAALVCVVVAVPCLIGLLGTVYQSRLEAARKQVAQPKKEYKTAGQEVSAGRDSESQRLLPDSRSRGDWAKINELHQIGRAVLVEPGTGVDVIEGPLSYRPWREVHAVDSYRVRLLGGEQTGLDVLLPADAIHPRRLAADSRP
jgi:hypothetical protein